MSIVPWTFDDDETKIFDLLNPPLNPPQNPVFPSPKNAPSIRNIEELIKVGKSDQSYTNIDMDMLKRILPYLEQLSDMIGMKKLKESIFLQIIYYLQHLHISDEESSLYSEKEPVSKKRKLELDKEVDLSLLKALADEAKRKEDIRLVRKRKYRSFTELKSSPILVEGPSIRLIHQKNTVDEGDFLHTIIYGAPGSGKSTVAKLLGLVYYSMGIFKTKTNTYNFSVAHRDDLVAEYLGQTAIKTKKFLDKHRGGVVVIDEAYSLGDTDKRDRFAVEAINTLVSYLSEHRDDICVILVGYEDEIKKVLFTMNAGLSRRFPWIHTVDKYTHIELTDIFFLKASSTTKKWKLTFTKEQLQKTLEHLKLKNLGGDIENIFNTSKMIHSVNSISMEISERRQISLKEVKEAITQLRLDVEERESAHLSMIL